MGARTHRRIRMPWRNVMRATAQMRRHSDAEEEVLEGRGRMLGRDDVRAGAAGGRHDGLASRLGDAGGPDLEHVAEPEEVVHATEFAEFASGEDADAVADVADVGQQVRREEDRLAFALEPQDKVLHLARADGVQAGRRFVEEQEFRVVDEGLGQADAPAHSLGVLAELACPGPPIQSDPVEEFGGPSAPLAAVEAEEATVEIDRLLAGQKAVQIGLFGQVADALVDGRRSRRQAEDTGAAGRREDQTQQQFDGGALAGTVGAEQPEDLAPPERQIEADQGVDLLSAPEVPVDLGQTLGDNGLRLLHACLADDLPRGLGAARQEGRGVNGYRPVASATSVVAPFSTGAVSARLASRNSCFA
ncbi:MAG: hypothetical protein AMK72_12285 [Planctomycetes bacterium SM23_25]|nr:MAG: hypothetical protein AMK72_12285 [Planctomycetes bacterium SM23_25]